MSDDAPARKHGLGRGLSSLLGEVEKEAPVSGLPPRGGIQRIEIADIDPNPAQPRRHFEEEALAELAESIQDRGLIQPVVVRPMNGRYQIVAGERRWRAAMKARLHQIPAIIRELSDGETLELAIIENIQRRDLNAIEEAEAYQRLIDEYGHSQEKLGRIVSKSRSHVANLLRLLDLPPSVKQHVVSGALSMGHARALLAANEPEALAREIIARGLSVRETEALVKQGKAAKSGAKAAPSPVNADVAALERQLGDILGLKVRITHSGNGGQVALHYSSLDQLDMICQRLSGERI